jgi:hypothetical protein
MRPGSVALGLGDDQQQLQQPAIDRECAVLGSGPPAVRARGMARLRILLTDGRGPMYRNDRGSLAAELRGVLAAL